VPRVRYPNQLVMPRGKTIDSSSPPTFNDDEGAPTVIRTGHPLRTLKSERFLVPRLLLTVQREHGKDSDQVVNFEGDLCRIGTHSSNDLVLTDPSVSRFHCKLQRCAEGWRIVDTSSLNGTFIGGLRVRDADVPDGTVLALGDSKVRVRSAASASEAPIATEASFGSMLGSSVAMRKLFAVLAKVAASDINVLIDGESGTGKELVATEIVQRGTRADGPFGIVDCSAISPNLVESELFGHVRGAFTGADRDRIGAFEAADGGTVFLDEVGELPIALQPKLLRALEAREIRRLGESKPRRVNVRVLSATNRDLEREVNKGRFREDLYFRLAVFSVRVPPLRERLEDVPVLVRGFLKLLGVPEAEALFSDKVLAEMQRHDWPGNVRELRNYVERTVVLERAPPASRQRIPSIPDGKAPEAPDLRVPFKLAKDAVVDNFERTYISALLEATGGNMSRAAREAGMDRMYLHRLVQKHGFRSPK